MGTFSSMQTRVNRRIIDLPTSVQAEVPQLVNLALTKLQERHNFRVMEQEIALFTQVGTHNVLTSVLGPAFVLPTTIPTFKEWRDEPWYLMNTDGSPRFMSWAASRAAIWGAFTQGGTTVSDQSFPQILLEEPGDLLNNIRTVSVYPIADGVSDYPDGEYRITAPYYAYVPTLVNGGDSNWLTTQPSGEEFIVRYAAAEGFSLNWDYEKEAILKQEAQEHFHDLVSADKKYRMGSVREWVPHWRGVHANRTRL